MIELIILTFAVHHAVCFAAISCSHYYLDVHGIFTCTDWPMDTLDVFSTSVDFNHTSNVIFK